MMLPNFNKVKESGYAAIYIPDLLSFEQRQEVLKYLIDVAATDPVLKNFSKEELEILPMKQAFDVFFGNKPMSISNNIASDMLKLAVGEEEAERVCGLIVEQENL